MSIIYITRLLERKCKISPSDHSWVFLKGTIWVACKSHPKKSTADFGVFCVVSSPPGFVCPLMLFWEWGTNRFSNSFKWQLKHLKMTKLSNRHESRVLSVYEGGVQRRPGNTKNFIGQEMARFVSEAMIEVSISWESLGFASSRWSCSNVALHWSNVQFLDMFLLLMLFSSMFFCFLNSTWNVQWKNMLPYHAPWSWWFEGQIPRPSTVPSHWRKDSRH